MVNGGEFGRYYNSIMVDPKRCISNNSVYISDQSKDSNLMKNKTIFPVYFSDMVAPLFIPVAPEKQRTNRRINRSNMGFINVRL